MEDTEVTENGRPTSNVFAQEAEWGKLFSELLQGTEVGSNEGYG